MIANIFRHFRARRTLSKDIVSMGGKPAGFFEPIESVRARFKEAAIAYESPVANCDRWQDEIAEDATCECGAHRDLHEWRCGPDADCMTRDDDDRPLDAYDPAPEDPNKCDCCGRSRAEHVPGAKPVR